MKFFGVIAGIAVVLLVAGSYIYFNSTAQAQAVSVASLKSGSWSDATVWSTGVVPAAGKSVAIAAGHTVTYDVLSDAVLSGVNVNGTLKFSRIANTRLKTNDNIIVMDGGYLDMGTAADFIPKNVKAEVIFVLPRGKVFTGGPSMVSSDTGLWAMGRWETHGAPLGNTWSKLASDAAAGATSVIVQNDVTDWYMGGDVVVTQTTNPLRPGACHYKMTCAYFFENELRKVAGLQALPGGKTQITLDQPLQFAHQGSGDTRGEVALLTRNVLVRTEIQGVSDTTLDTSVPERTFSHTMYMEGARGDIEYAEFKYMGHLSTLARYPIHAHKLGIKANGIIVRGNSIWRSGNRGYQPHDSQGILFEDNVAFDTVMSPYYVERSPNVDKQDAAIAPNNIWLIHNLGVQATQAPTVGTAQQNDDAIFWIENLDQVVLGNVGVGAGASSGSSGDIPAGGALPATTRAANGEGTGLFPSIRSDGTGVIRPPVFLKNEFHSNGRNGLKFWNRNGVLPYDFVDISVWRNGIDGINWGYYRSPHRVYQLKAIENDVGIGSSNIVGTGSRFVQDATIIGNKIGISQPAEISTSIYPDRPWIYTRVFLNNTVADISRVTGRICSDPTHESWPIASRLCHPGHTLMLAPVFNSATPIAIGAVPNGGNKNYMWRIKDAQGLPASYPKDFLLMRPDQADPANRTSFTAAFLSQGQP